MSELDSQGTCLRAPKHKPRGARRGSVFNVLRYGQPRLVAFKQTDVQRNKLNQQNLTPK